MTCPQCQQANPSYAKFCLECDVHLRSTGEGDPSGAPHAEMERALTKAQEQQTATSEILRVISQSLTDLQPAFDTIVPNAVRLTGALYGVVSPPVPIALAPRPLPSQGGIFRRS